VTDDELRALIQQSSELEELTKHPGWQVLVDYANHRMEAPKKAVLNAGVKDWDHYVKTTGWLTGVHAALDFPTTVAAMVQTELERRREADEPEL